MLTVQQFKLKHSKRTGLLFCTIVFVIHVLPLYIHRSSMLLLNLVMLQKYLQHTTTMYNDVVVTYITNARPEEHKNRFGPLTKDTQ